MRVGALKQFSRTSRFKDVPAGQLIPAMRFISSSLGVECSFCHVEGHFEKDEKKPKQIARDMMKMMFTLNKTNDWPFVSGAGTWTDDIFRSRDSGRGRS
jgi:hypothetical protein